MYTSLLASVSPCLRAAHAHTPNPGPGAKRLVLTPLLQLKVNQLLPLSGPLCAHPQNLGEDLESLVLPVKTQEFGITTRL